MLGHNFFWHTLVIFEMVYKYVYHDDTDINLCHGFIVLAKVLRLDRFLSSLMFRIIVLYPLVPAYSIA